MAIERTLSIIKPDPAKLTIVAENKLGGEVFATPAFVGNRVYLRAAESIDGKRQEHLLDAAVPQRLFIPPNVATGLQNIGDEEAWLVNYPEPAYDPELKDEQVEYSEDELEAGVVK